MHRNPVERGLWQSRNCGNGTVIAAVLSEKSVNWPTQAKTGLEWATRLFSTVVRVSRESLAVSVQICEHDSINREVAPSECQILAVARPGVTPDLTEGEVCDRFRGGAVNGLTPEVRDSIPGSNIGERISGGSPTDGRGPMFVSGGTWSSDVNGRKRGRPVPSLATISIVVV